MALEMRCETTTFRRRHLWNPALLAAALGAWALLPVSETVQAGETISADAATILDKYGEVTGGREAYAKIKNRVRNERIVHVGMGFEDKVVLYQAMPNKQYADIKSEAMGDTQHGTDGKLVWYLSEQTGAVVEEGEARLAALDAAALDRVVEWRTYYSKAEVEGEETVGDQKCKKIVLTPRHGEVETHYYAMDTHLLVKAIVTRISSQFPPMPFEMTFDDYKWVDGIYFPHKVHRAFDMCGSKREMLFVVDSIEHNVMLPTDRFDPPAKIRAVAFAEGTADLLHQIVTGEDPSSEKPKAAPCSKRGSSDKGEANSSAGAKKSPCGGGS